jgi:hypothetical protein
MLAERGLMSHLETTTSDGRAWGLEFRPGGDDMLVGPLSGFRRRSPTTVVTVIAPDAVPPGQPVGRREITEWKGPSGLEYFDFDGYQGLLHHGGGNWVLWNPDLSRLFVTAAPSWPTTWVHVRFVLRHLIVAGLLTRPDHHCIHSVVAESPGGGVMVVGPTGSGKTRLVNRLVEQGVVSGVVEDDCSVVDSDWGLTSLIPTEHELRRPRSLPVRVAILMDTDAAEPEAVTGEVAAAFAAATPTPWPAAWLPGATPRAARIGSPPAGCSALRVPARSDTDDEVLDAVVRLVASA